MPPATKLLATMLDCPDPGALAAFYAALTGWKIGYQDAEYVELEPPDAAHPSLSFQRVEGYTAPQWPGQGHPQQLHLDFGTDDDLDTAQRAAVELGAREPAQQPKPERWRVLLDPAGHPFCLCLNAPEPAG